MKAGKIKQDQLGTELLRVAYEKIIFTLGS